jgi:hypothetical protein
MYACVSKSWNGADQRLNSELRELLVMAAGVAYNRRMAKPSRDFFEVSCPCCGGLLKIDPDTRAVISHVAPVKPKTFNDLEAAAKAMRDNEGRKESIFRQAVDAEKNKKDLLEKKFQEAVKKAKETPDEGPRLRDFELD